MSEKPNTPEGWRALLEEAVREPELTQEQENGSRRARRRARKAARAEQRRRTKKAIDAERRREPVTVAGAALLLLAIVAIGLGTRWLTGDDSGTAAQPSATASASPTQAAPADPAPQNSPTTPPSAQEPPDLSDPDQVATAWAKAYFTRNPVEDEEPAAVVERASLWMTEALATNLADQDDPLWSELVSRGGVSEVTTAKAGEADAGLPPDTPVRVWREVTVTAEVEAYRDYTDTHTVQVEVMRQDKGEWLVTRVLGL